MQGENMKLVTQCHKLGCVDLTGYSVTNKIIPFARLLYFLWLFLHPTKKKK